MIALSQELPEEYIDPSSLQAFDFLIAQATNVLLKCLKT